MKTWRSRSLLRTLVILSLCSGLEVREPVQRISFTTARKLIETYGAETYQEKTYKGSGSVSSPFSVYSGRNQAETRLTTRSLSNKTPEKVSNSTEKPKPLDFLFSRCEDPYWDDGIGGCLRDHLRVLLELMRPFFFLGFPIGNNSLVLDPLAPGDVDDWRHWPPKWQLHEFQVTGLGGITLEEFAMTMEKVTVKINIPQLRIQGGLRLRFLSWIPRLAVEVLRLRLILIGSWSVKDSSLRFTNITGQFWSEGHSVTLVDVGSILWAPTFEKDD